ncbi:unannotated protein [freshwater metagenome]|uniref:Unannotated protein n=2 Tax=freshwater metagenome TaxID=449393 RepID=A0A6J5ZPY6_9ZZZZ|nr:NAD(+)/NADH kinase [Actinomycetota bacterium]
MSVQPISGSITAFSHARPGQTDDALRHLIGLAHSRDLTVRLDPEETAKHPSIDAGPGVELNAELDRDAGLAVAFGGDGTVLRALRAYAGTSVPVIGINFGEIGFLAAIDRDDVAAGLEGAVRGEFERLVLPAIEVEVDGTSWLAINDIAITRRAGDRVAQLAYAVGGDEAGSVRCDGLVVATAAGSTGYNLANGGPVMAWGVEGYVVSFIAPHSLTARALVIAPEDELLVDNRSHDPVELSIDGRPVAEIASGGQVTARFSPDQAVLALPVDSSFYRRLRETFGRLSSS